MQNLKDNICLKLRSCFPLEHKEQNSSYLAGGLSMIMSMDSWVLELTEAHL